MNVNSVLNRLAFVEREVARKLPARDSEALTVAEAMTPAELHELAALMDGRDFPELADAELERVCELTRQAIERGDGHIPLGVLIPPDPIDPKEER